MLRKQNITYEVETFIHLLQPILDVNLTFMLKTHRARETVPRDALNSGFFSPELDMSGGSAAAQYP